MLALFDQLRRGGPRPDVPLIVLSGAGTDSTQMLLSSGDQVRQQIEGSQRLYDAITAAAPVSEHRVLHDASHLTIPLARPDAANRPSRISSRSARLQWRRRQYLTASRASQPAGSDTAMSWCSESLSRTSQADAATVKSRLCAAIRRDAKSGKLSVSCSDYIVSAGEPSRPRWPQRGPHRERPTRSGPRSWIRLSRSSTTSWSLTSTRPASSGIPSPGSSPG